MVDENPEKKTDGGTGAAETPPSNADSGSNVASFAATGRGKPCPICGRASVVEMRPFCSKRCADIDLGRWLGEAYRIPSVEQPTSEEEPSSPPGDGSGKP